MSGSERKPVYPVLDGHLRILQARTHLHLPTHQSYWQGTDVRVAAAFPGEGTSMASSTYSTLQVDARRTVAVWD